MDSPVHDADWSPGPKTDPAGEPIDSEASAWLIEIAEQIERDPEECRHAIETLESLEPELRFSIIAELAALAERPGAEMLLRLLSSAEDPATRMAALLALEGIDDADAGPTASAASPLPTPEVDGGNCDESSAEVDGGNCDKTSAAAGDVERIENPSYSDAPSVTGVAHWEDPRLVGSLVTAVDGQGRGLVAVSVSERGERTTAAFLCDVRRGICNVVGETEPESTVAGGLIDQFEAQSDGVCARNLPELALGLLAGSLMLCGGPADPLVREWLLRTLGPGFQPGGLPAMIPGLGVSPIPQAALVAQAATVLDACPSWLDASALTYELAEEIWLREGRIDADPERDRGAYRFLFEHRLIHCLELYQRMLFWMAWLWRAVDELELARSALALAAQLVDEQYAVPSNPFTVELTTRSFKAAQHGLGSTADPRTNHWT